MADHNHLRSKPSGHQIPSTIQHDATSAVLLLRSTARSDWEACAVVQACVTPVGRSFGGPYDSASVGKPWVVTGLHWQTEQPLALHSSLSHVHEAVETARFGFKAEPLPCCWKILGLDSTSQPPHRGSPFHVGARELSQKGKGVRAMAPTCHHRRVGVAKCSFLSAKDDVP